MSLRKVTQIGTPASPVMVRVLRDQESREFVVRLYERGVPQPAAEYFTDDLDDACSTAEVMFERVDAYLLH